MWEYYHDGTEYFDIIWLGLVAVSGLLLLFYILESFDKRKNPEKYAEIENYDWKSALEEEWKSDSIF